MRYISEQVRELREIAEMYDGMDGGDILREAADTIESLSSTLNKDEEKCRYKHAEVYHIGETVNKLHELCGEEIGWIHCGREIADSFQMINKLCGVIESLFAKLQAADMERSGDCGGWIPCKERLPEKSNSYLVTKHIAESEDCIERYETCSEIFWTRDNKWDCERDPDCEWKVIAWQPLPEPYHES